LTAEPGVIGGIPQSGLDFGAVLNADAIIQQNQQFDFYDGGGLDMACLGMAQVDASGHVNVSRFGSRLAGAGGFINISQNAAAVVFVGTFTAQGLRVSIDNGRLRIVSEGRTAKFIKSVEQITFNGKFAAKSGQRILYVTERCVFQLTDRGLELTEVAPGIDINRDILGQMQFEPVIKNPKLMDASLFAPGKMDLRQLLATSSTTNIPTRHSKRALP
jgi:propionate CoA-transferase